MSFSIMGLAQATVMCLVDDAYWRNSHKRRRSNAQKAPHLNSHILTAMWGMARQINEEKTRQKLLVSSSFSIQLNARLSALLTSCRPAYALAGSSALEKEQFLLTIRQLGFGLTVLCDDRKQTALIGLTIFTTGWWKEMSLRVKRGTIFLSWESFHDLRILSPPTLG